MSGSHIRMVLLGKTGAGKSSLANTLLKESEFKIHHGADSGTSECQTETNDVYGRTITLTDTPGFFDSKKSEEELKPAIIKCITDCSPGPHAFLILLKVDRFTDQENEVISKIKKAFSEEAFKHAVVVFTHGDQLPDNMTIEQFFGKNEKLYDLLMKCGGRYHVIDNKYWSNQVQVAALLNTIDRMIEANGGGYYTNEMLQEVESSIQEEEENIRQTEENMSEQEIGEKAKRKVGDVLKQIAGVTTRILLEAFLGVSVSSIKRGVAGKRTAKDFSAGASGHHTGSEESDEADSVAGAMKNTAPNRRIVLLGKIGVGKSSLANTILGETLFGTSCSAASGISECQTEKREVNGKPITLTDTPGFFDCNKSKKDLKSAIMKCITDCSPGPHAFLIVLKVERFTDRENEVITEIQKSFSEEAFKYAVVVFTHGDQLDDNMMIEEFVGENEKLCDLLQKCGGRYHVVDNKYWKNQQDGYRSNQVQVEALLNTIDRMIEANGGGYYTNEVFQEVKRRIREVDENFKETAINMSQDSCIVL